MSRLSQSVHNDLDRVMPTTSPRQLIHKIYSYPFPFPLGNLRYPLPAQYKCKTYKYNVFLKTNVHVPPSTGVNSCTDASGSQPKSNTKKNRILPAKSVNKKQVEECPRTNKSSLKTTNHVDSSISSKRTVINSNSYSVCQTCNKCLISANHDVCVVNYLHSVNASPSVKNFMRKVKQVWKATGKVLTSVGYQWRSTGRIFTLGELCPLTRLTKSKVVPAKQTENVITSKTVITMKLSHTAQKPLTRYQHRNQYQAVLVRLPTSPENQAIAHANQQEPNQNWGSNFPNPLSSFIFKCKSYRSKHSCYVRDTDGVELIKGYGGSNLYTISVEDMMKSSSICLFSKASKNKSWLWHRRLNHLNFGTINDLARKDLVRGLPRLKFEKDHLCSAFLRTPQQNDIVERRNCTLVKAAKTMLIFSKAPMFLWAEAVAIAFFGALCYPTNDSEDLGKLQPTADIGIFVRYAPSRKGYRIYNKRTRRIMETINVQFDELSEPMALVQLSTRPAPTFLTPGQISLELVPNPVPANSRLHGSMEGANNLPPICGHMELLTMFLSGTIVVCMNWINFPPIHAACLEKLSS
ncbi:integrase, catalytic region, zinc finger, CCHC-type containing protein [Tanacetum coccineum]